MVIFCMSHMLRLCVQQHIHDSQKLSCMVHRTLHITQVRFVVNNCKVYSSKKIAYGSRNDLKGCGTQ